MRRGLWFRFQMMFLLALLAAGHGVLTRTTCLVADTLDGASAVAIVADTPCATGETGCHADCGLTAMPACAFAARLLAAPSAGTDPACDSGYIARATDPPIRPPIV